jgi:hypothetical protein
LYAYVTNSFKSVTEHSVRGVVGEVEVETTRPKENIAWEGSYNERSNGWQITAQRPSILSEAPKSLEYVVNDRPSLVG